MLEDAAAEAAAAAASAAEARELEYDAYDEVTPGLPRFLRYDLVEGGSGRVGGSVGAVDSVGFDEGFFEDVGLIFLCLLAILSKYDPEEGASGVAAGAVDFASDVGDAGPTGVEGRDSESDSVLVFRSEETGVEEESGKEGDAISTGVEEGDFAEYDGVLICFPSRLSKYDSVEEAAGKEVDEDWIVFEGGLSAEYDGVDVC